MSKYSNLPGSQYITKQQEKACRKMFTKWVTSNLFTKQLSFFFFFTKWVTWNLFNKKKFHWYWDIFHALVQINKDIFQILSVSNLSNLDFNDFGEKLDKAALHRPPRSFWIKDTIIIQRDVDVETILNSESREDITK